MPRHGQYLELKRCPHCNVDRPTLSRAGNIFQTATHDKRNERSWGNYACASCGGVILAWSHKNSAEIQKMYPPPMEVDETVPTRAKEYLEQAISSINAPAGAVMLAASAVDAMLKDKNLTSGSLYSRIKKAVETHLITPEMEKWAHEVRLEANDQRHSDNGSTLPSPEDAERVIDFVQALATFLYVLPARVSRGIESATN